MLKRSELRSLRSGIVCVRVRDTDSLAHIRLQARLRARQPPDVILCHRVYVCA